MQKKDNSKIEKKRKELEKTILEEEKKKALEMDIASSLRDTDFNVLEVYLKN